MIKDEAGGAGFPWIADPTEKELEDNRPELSHAIRQIQAIADEWVVTGRIPDGDPVPLRDRSVTGELIEGDVREHLRHLTTQGAEGTAVSDTTENWQHVVPYFRSRAATRLAKMALAGTSLTAKEVVSAMFLMASDQGGISIAPDEEQPEMPGAWATIFYWLAEHLGPDVKRADRALDAVDVRYIVLAFRKIETAESTAQIEDAELRATEAIARAESLEKVIQTIETARPIPELSTGALHALMARPNKSLRRINRLAGKGVSIGADQKKILKEFASAKLETISHHELYVLVGLATLAKETGQLEGHPWTMTPKALEPPPRIRVPFPGYSDIARVLNVAEDKDGRIPKAMREALEDAVDRLSSEERFIVTRVLVASPSGRGQQMVESISKDKWLVKTVLETGQVYLDIHPAMIATALRSYIQVPNLPASHAAAREALGLREIRKDHTAADLYMRELALGLWGAHRSKTRKLAQKGVEIQEMVGDTALAKVDHKNMLETLGLVAYAKKWGREKAVARVEEDLNFCIQMGTLRSFEANGSNWELMIPDPDGSMDTAVQLPLLDESDDDPELNHQ